MARTRAWRRHHHRRIIRRWQRVFWNVLPLLPEELHDLATGGHWTVTEAGRFRKFRLSCDHHRVCCWYRRSTSFRFSRPAFYRRLDAVEAVAC